MRSRALDVSGSALLVGAAAWLGAHVTSIPFGARPVEGAAEPVFGDEFWRHWGDGQAELCSYDLTFPRYGAAREGIAVAIFVTETFSRKARVKADPGRHPESDELLVMKLNLVQDFPTGIYDYGLMTSVFSALVPFEGRPAGSIAKISFSSQEWCGHVYQQILPGERTVRSVSHSYFDGEGDRNETRRYPEGATFEDALPLWARGFAGPRLDPGGSIRGSLMRSTEIVRLHHRPLAWDPVTLSRGETPSTVDVPAGSFRVDTYSAEIGGEMPRTWTFLVEAESPHRLIRWTRSDGIRGDLVASERLRYWELNGPGLESELGTLGLSPRPGRTP